jgi:hypothetical protein
VNSARVLVPVVSLAFALGLVAPAAEAAPARKYKSEFVAAPAYPGSTMKLKVKRNPKAGDRVTLQVSGFNDADDDSFYLDVYVAPRNVVKTCPGNGDNMASLFIENSDVIGDIGTYSVGKSYKQNILYKSGSAKRVIYCAYSEYIVDDMAVGGLKHDFPTPRKKRR